MTNTSGNLNSIGFVLYVLFVIGFCTRSWACFNFFVMKGPLIQSYSHYYVKPKKKNSHEGTFSIELFQVWGKRKKKTFKQKSSKQTTAKKNSGLAVLAYAAAVEPNPSSLKCRCCHIMLENPLHERVPGSPSQRAPSSSVINSFHF